MLETTHTSFEGSASPDHRPPKEGSTSPDSRGKSSASPDPSTPAGKVLSHPKGAHSAHDNKYPRKGESPQLKGGQ